MQLSNQLVPSCSHPPEKPFMPPSLRTWGVNKHVFKQMNNTSHNISYQVFKDLIIMKNCLPKPKLWQKCQLISMLKPKLQHILNSHKYVLPKTDDLRECQTFFYT